jgi:hypothetical protein
MVDVLEALKVLMEAINEFFEDKTRQFFEGINKLGHWSAKSAIILKSKSH